MTLAVFGAAMAESNALSCRTFHTLLFLSKSMPSAPSSSTIAVPGRLSSLTRAPPRECPYTTDTPFCRAASSSFLMYFSRYGASALLWWIPSTKFAAQSAEVLVPATNISVSPVLGFLRMAYPSSLS